MSELQYLPTPVSKPPPPILSPTKRTRKDILECINSKSEDLRGERYKLQTALKLWSEHWNTDRSDHPVLAHLLIGKYPEDISMETLNYHDRHTVSKLRDAGEAMGFYICLANVVRWQAGREDYPDVCQSTFRGFVDCDGSKPFVGCVIENYGDFILLDEDAWNNVVPDDEEWGDPHDLSSTDYISRTWERTVSLPKYLNVIC